MERGIPALIVESEEMEIVPQSSELNHGTANGYPYFLLDASRLRCFGGSTPTDLLAARRTRPSACDMLSRFCARHALCWFVFLSVPTLRSWRRTASMSARWRASGTSTSRRGIDTYSKVGFAKLYTRKTPLTAADTLNARLIPFFDEHEIHVDRILTDRDTEHCGAHDRHEYELYLAVENIDHTRTKVKSPHTNGICERFHKTLLDEFYRVVFRKKLYDTPDAPQADLDAWMAVYNKQRTHQGRWCFGKTPMQTSTMLPAPPAVPRQGATRHAIRQDADQQHGGSETSVDRWIHRRLRHSRPDDHR
jgi:hypothetical protein